jgi:dolichol-phosphate mannosyltransferase
MSGFFLVRREYFMEVAHRISAIGFKILVDLLASSPRPPKVAEVPYTFRNRLHGESKLDVLVGLEYFQLILDKLIGNIIPPAFILFALVGGAGLSVYFSVFTLALFALRTTFDVAQISAAGAAMTVNFFLNNAITFRSARLKGWAILRGLLSFYIACSIGMWINLKMAHAAGALGSEWYTAGFLGLTVGSIWNYGVTQMFTWREGRKRLNRLASAALTQTPNPLSQPTVSPAPAKSQSASKPSVDLVSR